ncbi:hypothetical protein CXB51_034649 [Gossypium anomalum]|uniref:Uncharacterized protein n=1 Tax=Gossypium anomalum TaxID=47600 RepID=A0A8J5Y1R0_9ROSI|nr:hypothetical protein CXB51_034649 [Gossypium anomalum]
MFYSGELPFHLARNPHYVNAFTLASKNLIPSYIPSGYNKRECGGKKILVLYVMDGCTETTIDELYGRGVIFLKVVNCEKEYNDKFYVATGSLVETQHPHIFRTPYVVRTRNFALKNICAAKNTKKISYDAIFIRNFIMNHSMRLVIFNSFVSFKLLAVADTQYVSMIVMLKRPKLIKRSLQNMTSIYRHEGKKGDERSIFYKVIYDILINRWTTTLLYGLFFKSKRNWSTYSFIHSMKRNKINPQQILFIIKERTRCGRLEVMYLTHLKELEFSKLLANISMNRIWRW